MTFTSLLPKVSIIIPTYNEEDNIAQLLMQIRSASDIYNQKFKYETIVVDDGTDKTQEVAHMYEAKIVLGKHRGLGQAIIDGISNASNDIIVIMDADLSHSPHVIPEMVKLIVTKGYDMIIGSRYVKGGNSIGWETKRRLISRCACLLALSVTNIKDSTSGFFAFRKDLLQGVELKGNSWKIMLEVLIKCNPIKVCEVPMTFRVRERGKSKFNSKQMITYIKHLCKLAWFKYSRIKLFVGKNMEDANYEWYAYYKGNAIQKWWKHRIVKYVKEMIGDREWQIIFDYGCGSSPIACELGNQIYYGVDRNKNKIDYVSKKLPYQYSTESQYPDNKTCDVSMAIEVIEHMPTITEAHWLVKMLRDKTKDDGTIIIATPDFKSIGWKIVEFVYKKLMPSAYANDHRIRFGENELIELCKSYELEHVETKRVAGCDMIIKFRRIKND